MKPGRPPRRAAAAPNARTRLLLFAATSPGIEGVAADEIAALGAEAPQSTPGGVEFEGDFGGNQVRGETVLEGESGWREIAGTRTDLDRDALANERRNLYLQVLPAILVPLKDKNSGFKIESASNAKIGDRQVVDLKVVPADGKPFTLTLDAATALPLRTVAKVLDWTGNEVTQEVTFDAYKEMSGIKKATKLHYKRDGERLMDVEILEFKFQG